MAPCRQLLMWSVPSIAVLLGIFWFRKKREYAKSDPGGRERIKSLKEELAEALNAQAEAQRTSPVGKAERAVIKSAPIDIVPNGSNSQRSSPLELTDEEVDIEIEKIIRKTSIEKEKRMSAGFGKFNSTSLCSKEPSFKIKQKSPNMCSTLPTVVNCQKSIVDHSPIIIRAGNTNIVHSQDMPGKSGDTFVQQDQSKLEAVESEVNTTEDSTVGDTEDENVNNNIVNVVDASSDSNDTDNRFSTTQSRHISERDSANHSPVDPMLASPSMCHFSDNHSEVRLNCSSICTFCGQSWLL